jgi:MFS family permease
VSRSDDAASPRASDHAPPAAPSRPERGNRRALAVLVGVVFLDLVGFGIVIPILPFYVRSFGVSDVLIGLLAASYSLAQFGAAPLLGRVSDRYGRRPVVTLTLLGSALAWTVFGLGGELGATLGATAGLAALFASRALAGAMGGNLSVAQAYVADVTAPERRTAALGLLGAAFSVGFIFGPAIGGLAADPRTVEAVRAVVPAAIPVTAFSLPSFAAAVTSLLAFLAALAFLREPARVPPEPTSPDATAAGTARPPAGGALAGLAAALQQPSLRGLALAFFLVSAAFSGVQVMFVPFAADFYGYSATATALFLTYIGALGAINQGVVVGRLARRVPERRLAIVGAVLLTAALALLPFAPAVGALLPPPGGPDWLTGPLVVLLVDGALLSLGLSLVNVSLATLVSRSAGAGSQGAAFGVTQGAGSLGRTVGPPAMAALYVVAFWSPFVIGAVLLAPVVWVLVRLGRRAAGATGESDDRFDVDADPTPRP